MTKWGHGHTFCQQFFYIKNIRICIMIWIIYVATERTFFQKNMVALQNLTPSENLAPLPLWEFILPSSKFPPQLLKSSPESHFFQPSLLLGRCILCPFYQNILNPTCKWLYFWKVLPFNAGGFKLWYNIMYLFCRDF